MWRYFLYMRYFEVFNVELCWLILLMFFQSIRMYTWYFRLYFDYHFLFRLLCVVGGIGSRGWLRAPVSDAGHVSLTTLCIRVRRSGMQSNVYVNMALPEEFEVMCHTVMEPKYWRCSSIGFGVASRKRIAHIQYVNEVAWFAPIARLVEFVDIFIPFHPKLTSRQRPYISMHYMYFIEGFQGHFCRA